MADEMNKEREDFYAWLRTHEDEVGAVDEASAWVGFLGGRASLAASAGSEPVTLDLEAWKCERCHGKGWHWQSESVNHGKGIGVENVDLRTHCDACEGSGWCGPDADRAAEAAKQKAENDLKVRGYLAATLKCWHRLTGDEAAELVAMTQRLAGLYQSHPSPPEGMVGGWQDIATAPKDGTSFLGHWQGGTYDCAIRAVKFHNGKWWEPNEDYLVREPTHWMPLPPPPLSKEGASHG